MCVFLEQHFYKQTWRATNLPKTSKKLQKTTKISSNFKLKRPKQQQKMSTSKDNDFSLNASLNCSMTRCNPDESSQKLVCADCKRSVHYKCTKLPAYQIQAYITKKKRNYYCASCIEVPAELERLINPISKEQHEINRLRRDIKRCENLTKVSEENSKLTQKLINDQLSKFDDKRIESYIDKIIS